MEAYPQKIRELILGSYEDGAKTAEIAETFEVSRSWARRVKQRLRECNSREATKQKHGCDPKLGEREREELAKLMEETPDATLEELKKKLSKPVSISTICRTLRQMRLTLKKKSLHASEQDRADVKRKREDWEQCLPGLDLNKLVFFDESGVNTLMARLRGRCLKGKRLVDSMPAGCYGTLTLMSAVRLDGVVAPMLLDGPVNAETFAGYVEQCLAPALEPGDILIMDNLPAHKSARITQAVEDAGCRLVYLPPYSPDWNPIENMWSKVKAILRKTAGRTFDAVAKGVREALLAITPDDCDGYFEHCGYGDTST